LNQPGRQGKKALSNRAKAASVQMGAQVQKGLEKNILEPPQSQR
jgi:hypothetical protein